MSLESDEKDYSDTGSSQGIKVKETSEKKGHTPGKFHQSVHAIDTVEEKFLKAID